MAVGWYPIKVLVQSSQLIKSVDHDLLTGPDALLDLYLITLSHTDFNQPSLKQALTVREERSCAQVCASGGWGTEHHLCHGRSGPV